MSVADFKWTIQCTGCKKCLNRSDFYNDAQKSTGHSSRCKKCIHEQSVEYYKNNKEMLISKSVKWQKDNLEKCKKWRKKYYQDHKEEIKVKHQAYYERKRNERNTSF